MDALVCAFLAVIGVSFLSFVGVFAISLDEKKLDNILFILISFAAGTILGAAYFDLLPEALELAGEELTVTYVALGFAVFFFLERSVYWYHGHVHEREIGKKTVVKNLVYMNIIGDGVHNLIDGMIITSTFLLNTSLGIVSTLAVVFHETAQEIGDFGVLIYGGYSKMKALLFNFLSALTAIVGVLFSVLFSGSVEGFVGFLVAFAAGAFIYLAASELIPEIKEEENFKRSAAQFMLFVLGLILVWSLGTVFHE